MPVDNDHDKPAEPTSGKQEPAPGPPLRGLRRFTRRHAVISGIIIAALVIALVLVGLLAYRLGYVDRYVAGQIKSTLANYGIRAEIKEFHTSISPQTVELVGLELYDAQSGEQLGKIGRMLAKVRIEDLYALNLRREINLKDLQIEGL